MDSGPILPPRAAPALHATIMRRTAFFLLAAATLVAHAHAAAKGEAPRGATLAGRRRPRCAPRKHLGRLALGAERGRGAPGPGGAGRGAGRRAPAVGCIASLLPHPHYHPTPTPHPHPPPPTNTHQHHPAAPTAIPKGGFENEGAPPGITGVWIDADGPVAGFVEADTYRGLAPNDTLYVATFTSYTCLGAGSYIAVRTLKLVWARAAGRVRPRAPLCAAPLRLPRGKRAPCAALPAPCAASTLPAPTGLCCPPAPQALDKEMWVDGKVVWSAKKCEEGTLSADGVTWNYTNVDAPACPAAGDQEPFSGTSTRVASSLDDQAAEQCAA